MALSGCAIPTDIHGHELKEHGNLFFPIACYDVHLSISDVPWHWHDEFEIAIVDRGQCCFSLENAHVELFPGDAIFVNAGGLHSMRQEPSLPAVVHSIVFHNRIISGNRDSIFWDRSVQPFLEDTALRYVVLRNDVPEQAAIRDLLHAAWNAVTTEPEDYEIITRYSLTLALRKLADGWASKAPALSDHERTEAVRIRTMLEYIHANYAYDLSVEGIAAQIHVSKSACQRIFHHLLDITPMQYVKNLRLERAAERLKSTRKTAKEIALECGFNDVSYLTKAFREKFAETPREYQLRHGEAYLKL